MPGGARTSFQHPGRVADSDLKSVEKNTVSRNDGAMNRR
jgi:hypothetical protein